MLKNSLYYLLLVAGFSLMLSACKTNAAATEVAAEENRREGPQLRSRTSANPQSREEATQVDRAALMPTEDELRGFSAEEVERERNSGGITQAEMNSLGITSTSPEAIAEARERRRTARQPLPENPTVEQLRDKSYLAVLRTTPCAGDDCPVYEFRILADYSFYFHGIENVDLPGHYFAKSSGNPMLELQQLVIRHRYLNFEKQYPHNSERSMDALSATITEIELMGRAKTVTNYTNAPAGLKEIEDYLFGLLEAADWTQVIEAQD
ncbi:MAG: DUF6438 domain-containing protein [Bacteroidota bacterium]